MSKDLVTKEDVMSAMIDPEMMEMYEGDAGMGAEEMGGSNASLKVYSAGKTLNAELPDGSSPHHGWFFYAPTQEEFEVIDMNILKISRGFYTKGMKQKDGTQKDVYNQLLAGVITNSGKNYPFVMYLSGLKLAPMWDLGKELSKYTRKMPIFAINVRMKTEEVKHDYGKSPVPLYEINLEEPLVTDPGRYQFLKDMFNQMIPVVDNIVSKGIAMDDEYTEEPPHPAQEA